MSEEDENVVVVHVEAEIVHGNKVSVIELLSEVLDSDDFLFSFHGFVLGLDLLDVWLGLILGIFHAAVG